MRFAREHPDLKKVQTLSAQLPWASHLVLLNKVRDPAARARYIELGVSEYQLLETLPGRYEARLPVLLRRRR